MIFYSPRSHFNPHKSSGLATRNVAGVLLLMLLAVFLGACGGPSGTPGGAQPTTAVSTLSPRLFILGTQVAINGDLRIFANGLDQDGNPLTLAQYGTATVTVSTAAGPVTYNVSGPEVTVKAIDPNEPLMSLALVTDYSGSIKIADLDRIADVNRTIIDALALSATFEAAVFNFSNDVDIRQDWTEDLASLRAAVVRDGTFFQDETALYDALGTALERGMTMDPNGLIERCRPIRMLVVHTDGLENVSGSYNKPELLTLIDNNRVIPIMLGTLSADTMELIEFAGERGAFVFDIDLAGIEAAVAEWVGSFQNLVEFTLTPTTDFDPGPVQIDLGLLTVMVEAPYNQACTMPP